MTGPSPFAGIPPALGLSKDELGLPFQTISSHLEGGRTQISNLSEKGLLRSIHLEE